MGFRTIRLLSGVVVVMGSSGFYRGDGCCFDLISDDKWRLCYLPRPYCLAVKDFPDYNPSHPLNS